MTTDGEGNWERVNKGMTSHKSEKLLPDVWLRRP
jgi:hypothetical protein